MIYLDNPATSRRKPVSVLSSLFYNTVFNSINAGRGTHRYSIRGACIMNEAAERVASLFKISQPERVAFTSNATLALNMAINGVLSEGGHAIVTSMEHNSVLRPVARLGNFTVVYAGEDGIVKPCDIEKAIREDTRLIICTHASNVCGSIQPVEEIGEIARRNNLLFLVDAAQTAGAIDIDVERMKIDLLAFSGHKGIMGPLGTGGLYVGERAQLKPFITGGTGSMSESLSQPEILPDMLQAGTVNLPAIAALSRAAEFIIENGTDTILAHERRLASDFINRIENGNGVRILGTGDIEKRNGTVAFIIEGIESQRVAELLDKKFKIAARGGWHCAYIAHETLGTKESGAVRIGFGYYNTVFDSIRAARAVNVIAERLKKGILYM